MDKPRDDPASDPENQPPDWPRLILDLIARNPETFARIRPYLRQEVVRDVDKAVAQLARDGLIRRDNLRNNVWVATESGAAKARGAHDAPSPR